MSLSRVESAIWHECQRILENQAMRKKDLLEWSTGPVAPRDGEVEIWRESLGVNAIVLASLDRRRGDG